MKASLYFAGNDGKFSKSAQETYFLSKAVKSNTDFTYQRKDKSMVVPYQVDSLYSVNYVMYQNHNFNNKWFYAFVTKMEYVDEETSRLYIETDPIQTWYADLTFKESFIEREHCDDDTIGINVIPEGLETGEMVINKAFTIPFHEEYIPCLAVTELPGGSGIIPRGRDDFKFYGGILSGISYIVARTSDTYYTDPHSLNAYAITQLVAYYDFGHADAINSIFMIPKSWCENLNGWSAIPGFPLVEWAVIEGATDGVEIFYDKPTAFEDYVPHNKKLLTFPYMYLNLTNNAGSDVTLHYEDFDNLSHTQTRYGFALDSNICPSISGLITPLNYKNRAYDYDEPYSIISYEYSIPLAKLPICSWTSDVYTNYLTQNAIDIPLNVITGGALITSGLANIGTENTAGLTQITHGINTIGNQLSEIYKKSLVPDQARGNTNTADVKFMLGLCNPSVYEYSIKRIQAVIIDKYFDMFGYKTNMVKTPNYNHRKNYWYTKTIDCNIEGNIPEEDMEMIKNCFNNGITFWKNPANMYDYSVDNSIV